MAKSRSGKEPFTPSLFNSGTYYPSVCTRSGTTVLESGRSYHIIRNDQYTRTLRHGLDIPSNKHTISILATEDQTEIAWNWLSPLQLKLPLDLHEFLACTDMVWIFRVGMKLLKDGQSLLVPAIVYKPTWTLRNPGTASEKE